MIPILFIFCVIIAAVAIKAIITKPKETPKKVEVAPAPAPDPSVLFFRLVMDEGSDSLFKKYGEPHPDYPLSKTELVDLGYIDARVFKYYEIEGEPEISDGVVSFRGSPVGHVKRNDKKQVAELLSSGCSPSLHIYGGPYKIITSDYDYARDRETYEMDRDEAPVSATLRINVK